MKPYLIAAVSLIFSAFVPVAATEGGGNAYALGVETNFSGMMLPEGSHLLVYYQNYTASRARDNDGRANRRFADFGMHADVVALRLSHVWRGIQLAGASLESRVVLPLPSLDLDLAIARPEPLAAIDRSGATRGPGDLTVAPLLLGWHGERLHQMTGVEMILPTGHYNRERPVNVGRNAWQLAAVYGVTWLPGRWEASARLRYALNGRNEATDYRSGNELSLEFSGGYRFAPGWSAGINGYVYRQTSDDRQAGAAVNGDGNRGSVDALGPYLAWSPAPGIGLVAKLQVESGARNRAEGRRFWLQGRYAF